MSGSTKCVQLHPGIPLRNKKAQTTDTHNNLDEYPGGYAEGQSQSPQITSCVVLIIEPCGDDKMVQVGNTLIFATEQGWDHQGVALKG